MKSLYEVLGVSRTAKPATIKRAYRKRAFATHPDRDGNRAEFEAVQAAWRILSDPARRARYDATGETDDAPDNLLAQTTSLLVGVFEKAVNNALSCGRKAGDADLVADMRRMLEVTGRELASQQKQLLNVKAYFQGLLGRFQTAEPDNLLEGVVQSQLAGQERHLEALAQQVAQNQQAQTLLGKYQFRCDVRTYGTRDVPMFIRAITTSV